MVAKCSYGAWERFAYQANSILRTFKNYSKSRSVNICFKIFWFGTLLTGGRLVTGAGRGTGGKHVSFQFHKMLKTLRRHQTTSKIWLLRNGLQPFPACKSLLHATRASRLPMVQYFIWLNTGTSIKLGAWILEPCLTGFCKGISNFRRSDGQALQIASNGSTSSY